jgi:hypothetical protein
MLHLSHGGFLGHQTPQELAGCLGVELAFEGLGFLGVDVFLEIPHSQHSRRRDPPTCTKQLHGGTISVHDAVQDALE